MNLSINGHTLHVETHGPQDGPAVVLLHHGLGSTRAWKEQVPALAEAGYHVVAYDRWGYGKSEARPGIDMPAFTQDIADLRALLGHFGLEEAALVGHSDGGTIALAYAASLDAPAANAATAPAAIPALTAPAAVPGGGKIMAGVRVSALVTIAAHAYVEAKMQHTIEQVLADYQNNARLRLGLGRIHGDKTDSVFHNWYGGWHRPECLGWDMRPQLRAITCPALVVQGLEDEHATPQHAQDIAAAIPGAALWLAPGAAHMLPQENAAAFNPRLLDFLAAVFGQTASGGQATSAAIGGRYVQQSSDR